VIVLGRTLKRFQVAPRRCRAIFFNGREVCTRASPADMRIVRLRPRVSKVIAETAAFWAPRPSRISSHMGPAPTGLPVRSNINRVMDLYPTKARRPEASVAMVAIVPTADGLCSSRTVRSTSSRTLSVVREEIFGPVVCAQRFDDRMRVGEGGQ